MPAWGGAARACLRLVLPSAGAGQRTCRHLGVVWLHHRLILLPRVLYRLQQQKRTSRDRTSPSACCKAWSSSPAGLPACRQQQAAPAAAAAASGADMHVPCRRAGRLLPCCSSCPSL